MNLPSFRKTTSQTELVENEVRTAHLIRAVWAAAHETERRDPRFITLVVQCGWTNVRKDGSGRDSTRVWRNRNLANYLGVQYQSDSQLAAALSVRFPGLREPLALLRSHTGITHYYTSLRTESLKFVHRHAEKVANAFESITDEHASTTDKIRKAFETVRQMGPIHIRNKSVSPLNCLAPALACLDPHRRFPIMNDRTERLLRIIGERHDPEGALSLCELIGRQGISNSFELDVYSFTEDFSHIQRPRAPRLRARHLTDLGLKSELESLAHIAADNITIRKIHNELTNRLLKFLRWRHITPKEHRFDVLIEGWKNGRHLLIEAKTASAGASGRTQIRQAIGQLFDYRFSHFKTKENVDLAVLVPSRPAADVQSLLASLDIHVLWFEGGRLKGSIRL
jgi:hypothetical protein